MRANDIIKQENLSVNDVIFIDGNTYKRYHKIPNKAVNEYIVVPSDRSGKKEIYIY